MRRIEQRADLREVARGERLRHRVHARVLGDHVAHAAVERGGQGIEVLRVPQRLDPECLAGGAALLAPLVVAGAGVLVLGARLERHELPVAEVQPDLLELEAAEVDPERVPGLRAQRGELVQEAGLRPDPVVLDARAELRDRDAVVGLIAEQREAQRGGERGGGGQPRALGQVAGDRDPRRVDLVAAGLQLGDHAAHERAPALAAAHGVEVELVLFAEVIGAGVEALAAELLRRDRHAAVDREREREAVVVVGVLADQVDPAGTKRGGHESRRRMTSTASGLSSISR
jgi:hypothetical protein